MSDLKRRLDRLAAALAAHDSTEIRQWLATLTGDQADYLRGALAQTPPPVMSDDELRALAADIQDYLEGRTARKE